jgi:fucose permease
MILFAEMGVLALWLLFLWLASAIIASYLSNRKGYGEKLGLAYGLVLSFVGALIWLFWPAKPESKWKLLGPIGRGSDEERIEAAQRQA